MKELLKDKIPSVIAVISLALTMSLTAIFITINPTGKLFFDLVKQNQGLTMLVFLCITLGLFSLGKIPTENKLAQNSIFWTWATWFGFMLAILFALAPGPMPLS
jgi:hypothetical protein